ncbi:type II toxin-antitoxin system HicA family toxin [Paenibacillus oleatilyticus]|uniref:Type II toxin-antitoxin system HicA family toxin n=1 Tax=Paenibacillus oleatilyticus TaxID=2594886 RepID=A0ABV4USX6_9BACL
MGKQVTVREALKALKAAGFVQSETGQTSHQRWVHKTDPTRYADISFHRSGQVIPIGTLKSIEKTSGVRF